MKMTLADQNMPETWPERGREREIEREVNVPLV